MSAVAATIVVTPCEVVGVLGDLVIVRVDVEEPDPYRVDRLGLVGARDARNVSHDLGDDAVLDPHAGSVGSRADASTTARL
jgi:hypothetical protein